MSTAAEQIIASTPESRGEALAVLLGEWAPAERAGLVAELVAGGADGSVALEGLLEARRAGHLAGAVWAQELAGRSALLWPPCLLPGEPETTGEALLTAAVGYLERRDVAMAQVLLKTADSGRIGQLRRAGFTHLAELLYLISFEQDFPTTRPHTSLDFEPTGTQNEPRLARLVERTYVGTRDCPQLSGTRSIQEVLAGYRATGSFHPSRWSIARDAGRDIGCLLLTEHPRQRQWELIYMGLVPEARGSGWGSEMVRYAQWQAREAGFSRLVLAVDADNGPARAIYDATGFSCWERQSVFWRSFRAS